MEKVTVYENNEIQVEMYKTVADWLQHLRNNEYRLNPIEQEQVLEEMLEQLRLTKEDLDGRRIVTTSKVPIIHRSTLPFELLPPYEIFMDAILLLSEALDNEDNQVDKTWKRNVARLVAYYSTYVNKEDCRLIFFPIPEKVTGFFTCTNEKQIILLPFILNDSDNFYRLYE